MTGRRAFLGGLVTASLLPTRSWADAGSPDYLAAAKRQNGDFVLCGLTHGGVELFALPLPARGHAAAAHPTRPEAVAFARRPGTFAIVVDCTTGQIIARLDAPPGRHFYGHGAFSANGDHLFTTENDYETGQGRIGVWQRSSGYRRVNEFPSGGIGPHELKLMPDGATLVIANGGIHTHPDQKREKLNFDDMRPNLSYMGTDGASVDRVELESALFQNSIRHLDVAENGTVAFALQSQNANADPTPLLGLHRIGAPAELLTAPDPIQMQLKGYAGSVAFSGDEKSVAITSPRGGVAHIYDVKSGTLSGRISQPDVCGISARRRGFILTDGRGKISHLSNKHRFVKTHADRSWDNHLIAL